MARNDCDWIKIDPKSRFGQKSGGTNFFYTWKFPILDQNLSEFQASNEYRLIRRPILYPKAPTWPIVSKASPFLWIEQPKTFSNGIY